MSQTKFNLENAILTARESINSQLAKYAEQKTHTVTSGETLSGIAGKYYQDTNLWPLIAAANNYKTLDQIHNLQIGKQLIIPPKRNLNSLEKNIQSGYQKQFQSTKDKITFRSDSQQAKSLMFHKKMLSNSLLRDQQAKELGLVSLKGVPGIVLKYPQAPYVHPKLAAILSEATSLPFLNQIRITEAFPATVMHMSSTHFNGQAVDLTIPDPRYAPILTKWFKQKGLRALNEYSSGSKYKTAGHIHISL